MVDYAHSELFWKGSVDKQWKIEYDGGLITNNELFSQSIDLSESLCSETDLRFGCCEASCLKFKVGNIVLPLIGKWLKISVTLDHNRDEPLTVGRYKVLSDKPTADRQHREIIAYDAMYDIINADVTAWYNTIFPDAESKVPLWQLRNSFMAHFGLEQVLPEEGLVNDDMVVAKTIQPEQLSGKDVITKICEINGCFGHITRDGKFRYVMLPRFIQGLYPRNDLFPANDLFPRNPRSERIGSGTYISCKYEDYQVKTIDKVQIRQEENDIGAIYPDTEISEEDNCYIIQGNFLVYGKSHEELSQIASRLLGVISGVVYRPFEADCMGNPCLEVGDAVRLSTKYELIESYILRRTLKGLQALRDDYVAEGQEKYQENVNGVQTSIQQLQGKSFKLEKTVEGLSAEIVDVAAGLDAKITATAGQFQVELNNSVSQLNNTITATAAGLEGQLTDTANGLQTQITANASGLSAEITRATGAEGQLSTNISATADGLSAEITRASTAEGNLSTSINATASSLSAEIIRAQGAEGTLSTSISAVAGEVNLKVSKDNIINEINLSTEGVAINASKIKLEGYTTINNGFSVDLAGNVTLQGDYTRVSIVNGVFTIRDYLTENFLRLSPNKISTGRTGYSEYNFLAWDAAGNPTVNASSVASVSANITSANITTLNVPYLYTSGSDDTVGNRIAWLKNQIELLWAAIK